MAWVAVGAAAVSAVGGALSARSAGRASERQQRAAIEAETRMAKEDREHEEKVRLETRKQKQDAVGAYGSYNSSVPKEEPEGMEEQDAGPDGRSKFFGAAGVPGVAGAAVRGVGAGGSFLSGISGQNWASGIGAVGSALSGAASERSAARQQATSIEAKERIAREEREYDDMVRAEVLKFKNDTMDKFKRYSSGGTGGKPVPKPRPIEAGLSTADVQTGSTGGAARYIDPARIQRY